MLGAEVLVAAGAAPSTAAARERLAATIPGGAALEALLALVERLGGERRALLRPDGLPLAPVTVAVPSPVDGYVRSVDALACGRVSMALGAGRARKQDSVDPAVGLVLGVRSGDRVAAGQTLATLHSRAPLSVDSDLVRRLQTAFLIAGAPAPAPPLVLETIR